MKCIHCGIDSNLKDRQANQSCCKSCKRAFAFEPGTIDLTLPNAKITDPLFAKIIAEISVNGTLFFTVKQFTYLLDRKLKKKAGSGIAVLVILYIMFNIFAGFGIGLALSLFFSEARWMVLGTCNIFFALYLQNISNSSNFRYQYRQAAAVMMRIVGFIVLLGGVGLGIFLKSLVSFGLDVAIGLLINYWGFLQQQKVSKSSEEFLVEIAQAKKWLLQWQSTHGNIDQLLPKPQAKLSATPDSAVTAYSFDRLVVCNQPAIAQILLENHFHFEHNCAILSITGYPENVCDTVLEMVRRNPDLIVYAFHDASPDGVNLIHRLRSESRWFPSPTVKIVDVGLLPRQAIAARHKMFIRRAAAAASAAHELSPATRHSLTAAELAWLDAGNYVELESFMPQQLIQTLQRSIAISRSSDLSSDGDVTIWSDDGVLSIDGFDGGGFG